MYTVEFPGLNLKFNVNPVAFTIGNFEVRWYGILISIGFLAAVFYTVTQCKKIDLAHEKLIDCIIVGLITGIVGARLYYVIFYPDISYITNFWDIFNIRQGGIAIYGGIIGGLTGGIVVAKKKNLNVFKCLDLVSIAFLIGQTVGRLGNFTNQEAFGSQTDNIFRMISKKTNGIAVHPCFLYESMWCLVGIFVLHFFNKQMKKFDGQTFLFYLIWYGIGRFFIEALRSDSLMIPLLNLKVSQVIAVLSVLFSTLIMTYILKKGEDFYE